MSSIPFDQHPKIAADMRKMNWTFQQIAERLGITAKAAYDLVSRRRRGGSMPKKVLIALPPAMLEQVDYIAQAEHRTRSDLIREALRRYLDNFRRTQGAHLTVSTIETPTAGA